MAATTALSFAEYLKTSFSDLDCEYADGEVRERSMPDFVHSRIQFRLCVALEKEPFMACPELRLLLRPGLVRIPDISLYEADPPRSNPPTTPPLVVIEIISEDDRYTNILKKLHEYQHWGVPHIWVVDPWLRKLQQYSSGILQEVTALEIPGTDIRITLDQLLAGLPLS